VTASAAQPHHLSQAELGAQTRERLLDAAERLFAEKGFAATSVRDITAAASSNVAAVNYHFGGKHNLYNEVFRRRMAAMREQRITSIRQARGGGGSLEGVLHAFATAFLQPLLDRGSGRLLIELISREMLDPQLPHELFLAEVVGPVQEVLAEAIIEVTSGLDAGPARLCVISIVGQLLQVAHRLRRHELAPGWGADIPALPEMVDQIVRFSAAGVRACARKTG
jgi:TetR/AcrR family transcriptional regulator, regulator of cefoperazone and chloramphenicol sensitivity